MQGGDPEWIYVTYLHFLLNVTYYMLWRQPDSNILKENPIYKLKYSI